MLHESDGGQTLRPGQGKTGRAQVCHGGSCPAVLLPGVPKTRRGKTRHGTHIAIANFLLYFADVSSDHRKRKLTYNIPGDAHFLTFSCYRQYPLLTKERTRQWFVDAMKTARTKHEFAIWAYVIMPEHIHLLVFPRPTEYRIERFLYDLKRPVSWKAKKHLIETGNEEWLNRLTVSKGKDDVFRFWQQGGGYDENLFKGKTIENVFDYIHANPIRRGLVKLATEWTWSSARYWEGCDDVLITMDEIDI